MTLQETSRDESDTPPIAPADMPGPRYKWAVVGMLWFICFFNYADRQAIAAVLDVLETEYGFTKTQLGLIGSAFMWVYALSAPFAGQVGDRFSRKFIILAGLYAWSAITGFTALCTRAWQFVLVRAAEGFGETFYFPASMSLVSDYHSTSTRSRAMSLHQTSVYAGIIGGSYFAGWMAQRYSWQAPFVILGVLGILLGMVLGVFIREPRRNEAQILEDAQRGVRTVTGGDTEADPHLIIAQPKSVPLMTFLADMSRTPTAVALVCAFAGANFVAGIFMLWTPKFLRDKFGMELAEAALTATIYIQVASMFGSVLGGILADRWSRRLAGGRIATQAAGMLFGAPFILVAAQTESRTLLVVAMTLFGLFKGIYDANIWASLYDVVPAARRGTSVGLMNMLGWLGAAIGTLAFGVVVDWGLTMSDALASTAVIYVVVASILLLAAFVFARRDVERARAMS